MLYLTAFTPINPKSLDIPPATALKIVFIHEKIPNFAFNKESRYHNKPTIIAIFRIFQMIGNAPLIRENIFPNIIFYCVMLNFNAKKNIITSISSKKYDCLSTCLMSLMFVNILMQ